MQSPTPNLEPNAEAIETALAKVYALLLDLNNKDKVSDKRDPPSAIVQDQVPQCPECTEFSECSINCMI